jgi:hypothetical protein
MRDFDHDYEIRIGDKVKIIETGKRYSITKPGSEGIVIDIEDGHSDGAVKRYAAHQRLANIYNTEEYSVGLRYFIQFYKLTGVSSVRDSFSIREMDVEKIG